MSQRDTTTETDDSPATDRRIPTIGRESLSGALGTVRRRVRSGAPAGVAGLASLLGGVRALRRGDRQQGYLWLGASGLLVAIALDQRRSAGDQPPVEPTDVVDTTPDIGDIEAGDAGGGREASADAASEVVGTGTAIDIEDAGSSPDREGGVDATDVDQTDVAEPGLDADRLADASEASDESAATDEPDTAERAETTESPETSETTETPEGESYEQFGAAAFDEHSSEVPVPQTVFDRNILSLGTEVFWGIREADDAVVVSGQFDPIQDGDGIRYVASSEVDGDRLLTVPDTVLNHWDAVAGGGMAVASGDDLAFLTADALQPDDQVRVVPEQWLEDVLEGGD